MFFVNRKQRMNLELVDCQDPTCKGKQGSKGICEPKFLS